MCSYRQASSQGAIGQHTIPVREKQKKIAKPAEDLLETKVVQPSVKVRNQVNKKQVETDGQTTGKGNPLGR